MSAALYAAAIGGVWLGACCMFALGAVIVQATRETIADRMAGRR